MAEKVERAKSLFVQLSDALAVDKHNLDECWVEQPDIFFRVSEGVATADQALAANEADIKQAKLEAAEDIRTQFERDEKKLTMAELDRQVDADDRVNTLRANRPELERTAARWRALQEAFRMRRYSLQGLTDLHIANYYQTNSGSASRGRVADDVRNAAGEERRNRNKADNKG